MSLDAGETQRSALREAMPFSGVRVSRVLAESTVAGMVTVVQTQLRR